MYINNLSEVRTKAAINDSILNYPTNGRGSIETIKKIYWYVIEISATKKATAVETVFGFFGIYCLN